MNYGTAPKNSSPSLRMTFFWGFSILLLCFLIESIIRISYLNSTTTSFPLDLIAIVRQPINNQLLQILLPIIIIGGYILAGFVSGRRIPSKAILVAGLVGGMWVLITASLMVAYFYNGISLANELGSSEFVRDNFTMPNFIAFLWSIPKDFLIAVVLSGLGGGIARIVPKKVKPQVAAKTY